MFDSIFYKKHRGKILVLFAFLVAISIFYAFTARAVTRTWDGGGGDNNWSTCANWSSDTCPTSSDLALFDGTSDKDATIDGSFGGSVLGLQITSGYDGIITQSRSLTIGNNSFSQAGGTFEQGTNTFDINDGSFTVSGGTFNSGAATSTIEGNFTHSGGTYSATDRVITFDGTISDSSTLTCTGTFSGRVNISKSTMFSIFLSFTLSSGCTATFNNTVSTEGPVTINGTANFGKTLDLQNNLILGSASTITFSTTSPTITIEGDLTIPSGATFDATGMTVTFDGGSSNPSTLTCTGTFGGKVNINKTSTSGSTSFTLASGCESDFATSISTDGPVTINGTANFGTTLDLQDSLTLGSAATMTFSTGSPTFTIEGNFTITSGATFNASGMTVTFDGGNSNPSTFTCTGTYSGIVNISKTGLSGSTSFTLASGCTANFATSVTTDAPVTINGTANFGTTLDLQDSLTLGSAATMTFSTGSPTFTIEGNFTITSGATFNASGMTVTFDGGNSNPSTFTCTGTYSGIVNISKTGVSGSTSFTLAASCTASFATTVTTDAPVTINGTANFGTTLDLQNSLTLGSASTITFSTGSPTITIEGDFTMNNGATFNASGMVLTFDGGISNPSTFTCTGTFSGAVNIAKTVNNGGTNFVLASGCTLSAAQNISTTCPVTINGTFVLAGYNLSAVSVTVANGGTLRLYGGQTLTSPTLSSGSTVEYYGPSTYTSLIAGSTYHHVIFSAGTYNLTGTYTVNGNFTNTGATYNQTSGTLTLSGTANTLSGNNTFNNLTKSVSATSTLTFAAGSTQTVNGTLTLGGSSASSRLVLQSSTGDEYYVAPEGTRTLNYLSITDFNNTSGTDIVCYGSVNCLDGGGNTNVLFEAPPPPSPKVQLNGGVRFGGVRLQ